MSIKKSYLIELDHELKNTQRVLDNLSDAHLDWRPHAKSMTMGELAAHVVELHNWVAKAIAKDIFDFHVDYVPFKVSTVEELKTVLREGHAANVKAIEEMADENWFTEWSLQAGDHVIAKMPRAGAMRFIVVNHLIHHRGQLTVYMRMLDIPVPGIYGPSADDKGA